jgi:signal transduction histidine kinase
MSAFFGQIGSLLTDAPGNVIYQLVLAFSVAASLQAAFVTWRTRKSRQDQRPVIGLGAMLAALGLVFVVALPPLDRAVVFMLLIGVIWLWAFPEPSRRPDMGAIVLTALAAIAAGISVVVFTSQGAAQGFNETVANMLWQTATIALVLIGAALLYIRRTDGFANGLAFLALAFVGHAIHLVVREEGDYSGIIRLAYVAAFPLLLTLTQRRRTAVRESAPDTGLGPPAAESIRSEADPKTLHALLALAGETDLAEANQAIARSVSHAMRADVCLVGYVADDKSRLDVACGYDLIREDYLQGTSAEDASVPRLVSAIQRGRALRLPAAGTAGDVQRLGDLLGLKNPGNLLSAPVIASDGHVLAALILLSPYSDRLWSNDDQNRLSRIAGALAPAIQRVRREGEAQPEPKAPGEALRDANEKIARLERRNRELSRQVEAIALQAEKDAAQPAELQALRDAKAQADLQIQQLQAELGARAESKPRGPEIEEELNAALRDMAHLQNELAVSNQKILDLEKKASGGRQKKEQAEVIASISQELRQPMSSIAGYTDLLLGESVGILGALQRKFVERIKASTERLGGLINDMIQLNTLEVGLSDLKPEAMDLNLIIDNALAYTSSQVREKKISIHLDLPKNVAPVNADREALQQILIHLLQNAGAVSPMDGTISLKVQTTEDEGRPFVMIQVTDTGGGIPEDDLPRVFTRLFRADNVLIQGVGDTGVGLSIARTLTEAQHGRIWVESQPGAGATFNVLLPAVPDAVSPPAGQGDD